MDSTQKFIEDSLIVQLDVEVDRFLINKYDHIRWDIIEVLYGMEYPGDKYMIDIFAFVVHAEERDYFFVVDVMFETPNAIFILDIREIDSDTLLDFINENKYIKHGI